MLLSYNASVPSTVVLILLKLITVASPSLMVLNFPLHGDKIGKDFKEDPTEYRSQ